MMAAPRGSVFDLDHIAQRLNVAEHEGGRRNAMLER
jgi:hypothetical protein